MNIKIIFITLGTILFLNMGGCTGNKTKDEKAFTRIVGLPIRHYLNITYTGSTPIDTQTMISFDLENKTADCVQIIAKPDLLYVYTEGQWTRIPNHMETTGVIIGPRGTPDAFTGDGIEPDYSSIPMDEYPIRMRVVILGKLCNSGKPSDEVTADYIELIVERH